MKNIIVTGANGFIGRYVVERLILGEYKLYTIDRNDYTCDNLGITHIKADLSDINNAASVINRINEADVMIHLAADISVPGNSLTLGNNVEGMISAIDVAKKTGVHHFIYLSSVPIIGKILYTPIEESHPVHPCSSYHWSKWLGEKMLEDCYDTFETITSIRIPSPIGKGMRTNVFLPLVLKKMLKGDEVEIYGEGKRIQNYIDVRDIAEAILNIIKNKPQGLYLIAGAKSVSNADLVELCKRITRSSSKIIKGMHIDTEECEQWFISYRKAKTAFGYSPQYNLESTIRWICEGL